jgi:uncharacterized protein
MRALLTTVATFAAVYLALVLFVYATQSRLVYFPEMPGRQLTASPADIGLAFEDVRIRTNDAIELHGWFVPAGAGAATVLFLHGNAGNISHRLDWLKILNGLGLAVLLLDYRGYGQSTGSPSEAGTYEDARAAWSYLTGVRNIAPRRVIIFGESLGGAVAAHLAQNVSPGGLITTSAFTSAPDLARHFYWYLPVRLIARIQYRTADYVARVRAPVLIIHSREDEIVPFAHGQALYARAAEPKEFVEIHGDHNAGFLMSEAQLTAALRRFLAENGLSS